ncbi:MAG: hypothetical protein JSR77_08410 [Planctomycetes bacterium]|nr:hypothetical protein [Planctomycetota bacterium]
MLARLAPLIASAVLCFGTVADRSNTEFVPSRHGFHFRNSFKGTSLPPALRNRGIEKQMQLPDHYGLCGGMSLAAADYFLANRDVPADTTPPKDATPLYDYIYERQVQSMGAMGIMATKFLQWMQLPDTSVEAEPSTASLTAAELPAIIKRLDAGEVVPLGLVYAKSNTSELGKSGEKERARLWENHQVLAFAATKIDENTIDIRLYDPNFPGDDGVIVHTVRTLREGLPSLVTCEQRASRGRVIKVRGVFAMPYVKRDPK